jgi:hypothetical protein
MTIFINQNFKGNNKNKFTVLLISFSMLTSFMIGLSIGLFNKDQNQILDNESSKYYSDLIHDDTENTEIKELLMNEISAKNIEKYLKYVKCF